MEQFFFNVTEIQKHHQVLYPQNTEVDYIWGYKAATEEIIKSIKKTKPGCFRDDVLYPLLLLYFHILESGLKLITRVIGQHKEDGCPFFKKINVSDKNLYNHDIEKLNEDVKSIFSLLEEGNIHRLSNYLRIDKIIEQFVKFDINSFSVRYKFNKSYKPYQLSKNQTGINLFELHKEMMEISDQIVNYICSDNFSICRNFSSSTLANLNLILNELNKYFNKIKHLDFKTIFSEDIGISNESEGTIGKCNFDGWAKDREKLKSVLNTFQDKELSLIVAGLYFSSNSVEIKTKSIHYYESWNLSEKINKILERTCHISTAIKNLTKYLNFLQSNFKPLPKGDA